MESCQVVVVEEDSSQQAGNKQQKESRPSRHRSKRQSNKSKLDSTTQSSDGAPTTRMIIDGDNEEEEDCEDSSELTREHPSRMTHGHWLQRYSGLHAADTTADNQVLRSPPASPAGTTNMHQSQQQQQQHQNRHSASKRPRLLARWTAAMWTGRSVQMGGSTSDVTTTTSKSHLAAPGGERAGASSAPPLATSDLMRREESQTGPATEGQHRGRPGSRKSREAHQQQGRHDSRAASSARLANGSHQNHFGCQFCGWRAHAASSSCSSSSSTLVSPAAVAPTPPPGPTSQLGSWLTWRSVAQSPTASSARRNKQNAADRKRQQQQPPPRAVLDVSGGGGDGDNGAPSRSPSQEQASRRSSPYRQIARFLGGAAGRQGRPQEQQEQQQQVVAKACSSSSSHSNSRGLVASLFVSPRKKRGVQMEASESSAGGEPKKSRDEREKFATKAKDGEEGEEGGEHFSKSDSRDKMSRANANEISRRIESIKGEMRDQSKQERSHDTPTDEMSAAGQQVNDNFKLLASNASGGDVSMAASLKVESKSAEQQDKDEDEGPDGSSSSSSFASDMLRANSDKAREGYANEPHDKSLDASQSKTQSGPRVDNYAPQLQLEATLSVGDSKFGQSQSEITQEDGAQREEQREAPITSRLISLAATAAAAQRRQFDQESEPGGGGGGGAQTSATVAHFAPLIQPTLASSSSSSFASSSINLDSATATTTAATTISTTQQSQPMDKIVKINPQAQLARNLSSIVTSSVEKAAGPSCPRPPLATDRNQQIKKSREEVAERARPHSQPSAKRQVAAAAANVVQDENSGSASQTTFGLKTNFKKLVKRQQSVDSYRMARDLKQKLKRQQQQQQQVGGSDRNRQGHHSHETIKSDGSHPTGRKFSMRAPLAGGAGDQLSGRTSEAIGGGEGGGGRGGPAISKPVVVEICVDPYARPGTFVLPGEQIAGAAAAAASGSDQEPRSGGERGKKTAKQVKETPQPPKTLSLMPTAMGAGGNGHPSPVSQSCVSPGGSLLMGSGFSGCITPTYPTHHLPSPKYVSPAAFIAMQKKHSNASTISSSLGVESLNLAASGQASGNNNGSGGDGGLAQPQTLTLAEAAAAAAAAASCKSDTESLFSLTPSGRASKTIDEQHLTSGQDGAKPADLHGPNGIAGGAQMSEIARTNQAEADAVAAAAAAQRRANLAEHIYDNKCGLGEDMKFLASLPELCDITFLVGETREPVCAVKSVLAARSRVFHKIFFGSRIKAAAAAAAAAEQRRAEQAAQAAVVDEQAQQQLVENQELQDRRRDSSPRSAGRNSILVTGPQSSTISPVPKSSLPNSRSSSPNNQSQPQWSVTADTSGLSSASARPANLVARADSIVVGVAGGRGGRVSVTSNGRESISRTSQGSTQPLIIGPGQVATPAPLSKGGHKSKSKGRLRDNSSSRVDDSQGGGGGGGGHSRLSRMFLNKRASDPSLKQQNNNQLSMGGGGGAGDPNSRRTGGPIDRMGSSDIAEGGQHLPAFQLTNGANQNYLDKMSSSQKSTTMIIEEFEPDVFRQLIEYIHTGCVLLQARTLLGLLNAADYYGLEQLRKACLRFVSCCITVDTVCSLLSTAERYIQYKCTKSIVQKVLEFVDTHANEIFKLNAFGLLPEHVVRLILARDGLQADEHAKYNGVYTWCEHYCRSYELTNMSDVMHNFLNLIQFHKIPTSVLLAEIYPCHIVPDDIFLSALAYQADPDVFEPQPSRQRRMTLPNSIMLKTDSPHERDQQRHSQDCSTVGQSTNGDRDIGRRQSNNSPGGVGDTSTSSGSQQKRLLGSRKSSGGATAGSSIAWTPTPSPPAPKLAASRKGSIAQVSLSGVKRLSHKLSIKRRHHSNMPSSSAIAGPITSEARRRRGSGGGISLSRSELSKQASLAARSSVASNSTLHQPPVNSRDPIEVGRQILDAYLLVKRQQEQEEEERRQREEDELRAAEEARRRAAGLDEPSGGRSSDSAQRLSRKPLVKTPSSSRKSFRDFKHISRRIFMRHSSSKAIPVESQSQSPTNSAGKVSSSHYRLNSREMSSDSGTSLQQAQSRFASMDKSEGQNEKQAQKVRRLMKIKRSETVFEAATSPPNKFSNQRRNIGN